MLRDLWEHCLINRIHTLDAAIQVVNKAQDILDQRNKELSEMSCAEREIYRNQVAEAQQDLYPN